MFVNRSLRDIVTILLVVVGIIVVCVLGITLVVGIIGGYLFNWNWTGIKTKTLWDWLNLFGVLAIPVVVGFGAVWFTVRQGKVADAENKDNQRETALQAYIDKISELLLKEHLGERTADGELIPEYKQVRNIARVRTRTVLTQLDARRKGIVLQFLYESGLIQFYRKYKDKAAIIDLSKADLSGTDLGAAHLSLVNLGNTNFTGVNLKGATLFNISFEDADLSEADLSKAHIVGVKFNEANLTNTNFSNTYFAGTNEFVGANLEGANLKDAKGITIEALEKQTNLLKGATMPDGSIHP